ncbi:hypothetical protein KEM52_002760 [Ascosphaera acerosa]|nr:hypothetical protein KEM52_002760 [Ascosphaera acerosa]
MFLARRPLAQIASASASRFQHVAVAVPSLLAPRCQAQAAGFSTSLPIARPQQPPSQQQQQPSDPNATAVGQPAPRLTASGKVRREVPLASQEPTKGLLQYALCVYDSSFRQVTDTRVRLN